MHVGLHEVDQSGDIIAWVRMTLLSDGTALVDRVANLEENHGEGHAAQTRADCQCGDASLQ
jgi:hypothetical protein